MNFLETLMALNECIEEKIDIEGNWGLEIEPSIVHKVLDGEITIEEAADIVIERNNSARNN